VSAIAPGLVRTEMARAFWLDHGAEIVSHIPLERISEHDNIAFVAPCSSAGSRRG